MPIYEYRCRACGKKFEKLVRLSTQTRDVACPACGQRQAEKTVSLVSAVSTSAPAGAGASAAACGPSS